MGTDNVHLRQVLRWRWYSWVQAQYLENRWSIQATKLLFPQPGFAHDKRFKQTSGRHFYWLSHILHTCLHSGLTIRVRVVGSHHCFMDICICPLEFFEIYSVTSGEVCYVPTCVSLNHVSFLSWGHDQRCRILLLSASPCSWDCHFFISGLEFITIFWGFEICFLKPHLATGLRAGCCPLAYFPQASSLPGLPCWSKLGSEKHFFSLHRPLGVMTGSGRAFNQQMISAPTTYQALS